MARPHKMGVDYFPLDVVNDVKLDLIEAEFGLTGFAVVVKLYQRIYELGYYCEWNDEVALLFAKKVGLGGSAVSEIVTAAIRRSLFDENIYKKYGVLTSRGIQKRYFEIVARRKNVEVEQRYLLVPHAQLPVNVYINPVNADMTYAETQVNADRSTQSKVKESKVKYYYNSGGGCDLNPFSDDTDARPDFNTPEAYASKMLVGFNSDKARQELIDFLDELDGDVVRHAIDISFESGKGTWRYAKSIMQRYVENRLKTLNAVLADEEAFAQKKQQSNSPEMEREYKWAR